MKKHYFVLGSLIGVTLALAAIAIYNYNTAPKGITVQQALHQRDAALADTAIQKAIVANDEQAITNLKGDVSALTTQKATLCAQLKTVKLAQPLCQ